MYKELLLIFIGGGGGSVIRYLVQMFMHYRITAYIFPWATFTVNIVGCFLIGLVYGMSAKMNISTETRLLLTTGFCGGFTTFSTFGYDNLELIRQGEWSLFLLYVVLSIILGVSACFAGAYLSK